MARRYPLLGLLKLADQERVVALQGLREAQQQLDQKNEAKLRSEATLAALDREFQSLAANGQALNVFELLARRGYRGSITAEIEQIQARVDECRESVEAMRQQVGETTTRRDGLARHCERRAEASQQAANKELEKFAAEIFLSRHARQHHEP